MMCHIYYYTLCGLEEFQTMNVKHKYCWVCQTFLLKQSTAEQEWGGAEEYHLNNISSTKDWNSKGIHSVFTWEKAGRLRNELWTVYLGHCAFYVTPASLHPGKKRAASQDHTEKAELKCLKLPVSVIRQVNSTVVMKWKFNLNQLQETTPNCILIGTKETVIW